MILHIECVIVKVELILYNAMFICMLQGNSRWIDIARQRFTPRIPVQAGVAQGSANPSAYRGILVTSGKQFTIDFVHWMQVRATMAACFGG